MVFTKRVFKNYSTIGALAPSSRFLYRKMTKAVEFDRDVHIVEFWPGDGVFTDKILKEMSKDSTMSIFEIDESFCALLREKYKNDSRVTVYGESACEIRKFFEKESVDYVISSLPLSFIDKHIVWDILEKSKQVLKTNGKFIQYQYFLQNKKQIKHYFPKTHYKFALLNFPPAFVYICHK